MIFRVINRFTVKKQLKKRNSFTQNAKIPK